MAEQLQVHVFGGSIGECIVLRLPGKRWAIIDVYLADLANPGSSPVIRFLKENGITELEFLCLTHPHNDHVRGASHLIRNYRIRRFLGFGALPPEKLYNQIVKILNTKAKRLNDNRLEEEGVSDLLEALAAVNEKVNRLLPGFPGDFSLDIIAFASPCRWTIRSLTPEANAQIPLWRKAFTSKLS